MLTAAIAICKKDLLMVFTHGAGLAQALLLGLLLVFLFSLSLNAGDRLSPQAAAAMFWLASAFCQVLVFNMLYAAEEAEKARLGLLMLPAPVQSVWLGKAAAGMVILAAAQCVFIPAVFVFLGQKMGEFWTLSLAGILIGDLGMAASGSLLGALSVGQSGRESLLSIVLFPLLTPLLLSVVKLASFGLEADPMLENALRWIGLAVAFDSIFLGAGLVLFPFVYNGED
ncbi:MAG: heme exporter protein CcmB [Mailhella sp.]|nr:heme exporter protein CcmB [Mailhella sp.]